MRVRWRELQRHYALHRGSDGKEVTPRADLEGLTANHLGAVHRHHRVRAVPQCVDARTKLCVESLLRVVALLRYTPAPEAARYGVVLVGNEGAVSESERVCNLTCHVCVINYNDYSFYHLLVGGTTYRGYLSHGAVRTHDLLEELSLHVVKQVLFRAEQAGRNQSVPLDNLAQLLRLAPRCVLTQRMPVLDLVPVGSQRERAVGAFANLALYVSQGLLPDVGAAHALVGALSVGVDDEVARAHRYQLDAVLGLQFGLSGSNTPRLRVGNLGGDGRDLLTVNHNLTDAGAVDGPVQQNLRDSSLDTVLVKLAEEQVPCGLYVPALRVDVVVRDVNPVLTCEDGVLDLSDLSLDSLRQLRTHDA